MAEVNLRSWSEISQASEGLQLDSTAATLEHILARFARLETRLVEHERRVAATLPPLQPEPDPPDAATLYTAAQPSFQPTSHQPYYTAGPSPTLHPLPQYTPTCWNPPIQHQQLGLRQYSQPSPHQPSCCDQPDYQPARQPDNGWDPVAQARYSTFGYPPWQPEYQPSRLPYSGTNFHIQQRIPEAGYHPWQPEYRPPRPLPFSNHSLNPPLPPTPPSSPSSWSSPSHCRSAATLLAAAPPPSSLPADMTPTMVFGEDVSDGIVPNNAARTVGATLDVPNDKVLEEIVKNDEESSQVLVEATTVKNMGYDDKNLPQNSNLLPLLKRGVGLLPIWKEVMKILIQEGFIKFRWISSGEYLHMSGQVGRRGITEGRHLTIRCVFDPGGDTSKLLLSSTLFIASWFPP